MPESIRENGREFPRYWGWGGGFQLRYLTLIRSEKDTILVLKLFQGSLAFVKPFQTVKKEKKSNNPASF